MELLFVRFFRLPEGHDDAVGKAENKRCADQDNEIGGKKGHDKYKRVVEIISRYEQPDAVIQEKATNQNQNDLSDQPEYTRHTAPSFGVLLRRPKATCHA